MRPRQAYQVFESLVAAERAYQHIDTAHDYTSREESLSSLREVFAFKKLCCELPEIAQHHSNTLQELDVPNAIDLASTHLSAYARNN